MNYDDLLIEAEKQGVELLENNCIGKLSGLCVNNIITINSEIETETEKLCVLAEELGHYHTTSGNILNQTKMENRKQERRARSWGYENLIPLHKLVDGYLYGTRNAYELSEYLGVTEKYLLAAMKYYYERYGLFVNYGDYKIYFNPLAICKKYKEW